MEEDENEECFSFEDLSCSKNRIENTHRRRHVPNIFPKDPNIYRAELKLMRSDEKIFQDKLKGCQRNKQYYVENKLGKINKLEKPLNQLTELVNIDTTSKKVSMLEKLAKKKVCVTPAVIEESNTQTNKRRGRPPKQDNLPIVPLVTNEVINEIVNTPLSFVGNSLLDEMEEVANDAVHNSVDVENRDILLNDAEKIIQPVIVNSRTYTSSVERTHPRVTTKKRQNKFVTVEQFWNYDQPCGHCGCIWLTTHTRLQMRKCCKGGKVITDHVFPKLFPLPDSLKCLALERGRHMGQSSAMYNNIFSIAGVGVDNGKGGRFETIIGTSNVKVNGRLYSFLPKATNSGKMAGGLAYFTFEGAGLTDHADQLNKKNDNINSLFLMEIYEDLKTINPYAITLQDYGTQLKEYLEVIRTDKSRTLEEHYSLLKQSMNEASSKFQVLSSFILFFRDEFVLNRLVELFLILILEI
jgi:hypothetical protein